MQYIVSRNIVVQYCTKYVTKSETRSQSLKDTFANIAHSLKEGNLSVKAVQKFLINAIGERDYSAQETCHLLLQLPMYKASRSFTYLSLDGSRAVEGNAQEGERGQQLILCWIFMYHVQLLNTSTQSLSWISLVSIQCLRNWVLNQRREVKR